MVKSKSNIVGLIFTISVLNPYYFHEETSAVTCWCNFVRSTGEITWFADGFLYAGTVHSNGTMTGSQDDEAGTVFPFIGIIQ